MSNKLKVLFLTPWYPSEQDAMSGLFVQKHVEAVRALGADVRVMCTQTGWDTWEEWKALEREGWLPDVVQLNVIQKQGLLAMLLKARYNIPYVIVEHWSGYLPECGRYKKMIPFHRRMYERIADYAEVILTVSPRLQQAMRDCGIQAKRWGTIDNVVDDFFFQSPITNDQSPIKTLLHVSCFDERAKNVKGLLRAAKMLGLKRQDWRLVLVGTGADYESDRAFADTLDMPEGLLQWTGELPPEEVAQWMKRSDALVLSSRYETYGVVLAEAAAAGLPIVSTPVGIAEEVGALIVPQEIAKHKPGRFAEFLETILWNNKAGKTERETKERFTAEAIGKKLVGIYEQIQTH